MSDRARQPIGFVAWGGHTVAELLGVDRWSVRVNGREDAQTAGNLAALYQGTYGGPADGHYGYRILTDLAGRMDGTWVFNQPPPRPGSVLPVGTSSAEFARGGGGGAKGGKKGKAAAKAKAKGAVQAGGKGGVCCKGEGGKFAPGNNYGSLNKGSAKVAANVAGKRASKAAREAEVRVEATRRGAGPAAAIRARKCGRGCGGVQGQGGPRQGSCREGEEGVPATRRHASGGRRRGRRRRHGRRPNGRRWVVSPRPSSGAIPLPWSGRWRRSRRS